MIKDITGIILCGGKSSRMQVDKALLKLNGRTVIEIIAEKMKSIFSEVLISTNGIDDYNFLNLPLIKDIFTHKGPLAGIHSALKYSSTEKNFIISCDMPLVSSELIKFIATYNSDKKIILPEAEGRIQQLCGIYSKSLLPNIEDIILASEKAGNIKGSIYDLIERVSADIVNVESLTFYDKNFFLNMNTPEDYEQIKKIHKTN
jgi:molybdopterin-guanine dinucleotide biosynthesis protein A